MRIIKKDIFENQGDVPVISGHKARDSYLGYISEQWLINHNIPIYTEKLITINSNGNVGGVFLRNLSKYTFHDDVTGIKIRNEALNYEYIIYAIKNALADKDFSWSHKLYQKTLEKVGIIVPIDKNGSFDIEAQEQIVQRNRAFSSIKEQVTLLKGEIETTRVGFDVGDTHNKEVPIGDIFSLPSIKGLTKRFIETHSGEIPVYGGKQEEIPIGYVKDKLVNVKYFENCLAWNREGSVGYVFWHKSKFTTNDHHRPTTLKPEYEGRVDLSYMRYAIEDVLLKQGFRWSKTAGKEKVGRITVKVPTTPKGEFDILKQKEIAQKYEKIDQIKRELSEKLDTLLKCNISVE